MCEDVDYADPEGAVAAVAPHLVADLAGMLDLCALPEDGVATASPEHDGGPWLSRLAILQRIVAARRPGQPLRILQATSGLLDLPGTRPDLTGARLAGFVRGLGAEYPSVHSTVVDVDRPERVVERAAELAREWAAVHPYGEICRRDGVRHRPSFEPAPPPRESGWRADPDRVYIVTGGTRGLGALVARHLVDRGARQLAILGLRPLPPRHEWDGASEPAVEHLRHLERRGARVAVHTGPLSDRAALEAFLIGTRRSLGPIAGVVHCAGRSSIAPAAFVHKGLNDIRTVLEPKGDGVDVLTELTAADPLEFFLLYSSVSSAVPALGAGVSDYAAANAYLDFLAAHRVRSGQTWFRAVNWPVWGETGGGTARPDAAAPVGLGALTDADGLAVLDRVLALPPTSAVLPSPALAGGFDVEAAVRVRRADPGSRVPVGRGDSAVRMPAGRADSGFGAPVGPAVDDGPPDWLVGIFADAIGIAAGDLDDTAMFGDLGVESVLLGDLLGRLETVLGLALEPALLLDHPTLRSLAAHLASLGVGPVEPVTDGPSEDRLPAIAGSGGPPAATGGPERPAVGSGRAMPGDARIAVIGMACRLPGAPDLAAFWELLRSGGCAVTEVPADRWNAGELYAPQRTAGRSISKWGGFVDGVEDFDPDFFGMSDGDARDLDPAIRMTLESTAACLRDAGYRDEEVRGRDVGVFMGARMSGYRRRIDAASAATGLGGDQNFIAARVAHEFDLRGPCLVVDSACSSALVSVQLAVRSLLAGESEIALAGGVEVLLDAEPYLEFSAARALSPTGRCATFDRDADGFVPGEGCGVLLLKPLDRAVADGDRVHAVIDAVAVGNDGRTMGLTTPNPAAQARVVRRALALAGRDAGQIGMVEAHGTATMIGDPIELRALTDAFAADTDRRGYCAIGSVKSNVGHLLSAAGIAGLLKVLMALEHGEIPATLFCRNPNPRFDFAGSPFFPNTSSRPWPAGPRVAGVSAFGLGGTNAHLIASEAPPAAAVRRPLPAPVFHRRRLWWDAPATPTPPPVVAPYTNGHRPRLVASVLGLSFGSENQP
jgi:3-oxoacyl-(acyl-carrier-protein) synthase